MKITVIIPVGPGHEKCAFEAMTSAGTAWDYSHGPFTHLCVVMIGDTHGKLGRSGARNRGLDCNEADWFFLLDADDEMLPGAFREVNLNFPATFGAVCVNDDIIAANVYPLTRKMILRCGAHGTLSMGFFLKGDVETRFDETLDKGEDFDFYMRLPGFKKVMAPLVSIGRNIPSAGGPRGYGKIKWLDICNEVIDKYR